MSQKLARDMLKTLPRFAEGGAAVAEITKLYEDVLGRAPDAEGLAYWAKDFGADGVIDDREKAIFAQAAQNELSVRPQITQLYQDTLGRTPDADGLAYWIKDFGSDGAVDDREKAIFAGSAKNEISTTAALTKLYNDVLGRAPDADGLLYWIKQFGSDGIIDPKERASFNASAQIELKNREVKRLEAERLEAQRLEAQRLEAQRLEAERQRREMERLAQERMEREKILPFPLPGTENPYTPPLPSPNVVSPPPVYPINVTPTPGIAPERPIAAVPNTFSGTYNPDLFNEVVARAYKPPAFIGPTYGAFDTNRFIQDPNTFLGTYDSNFFNRLRRPPAPLPAEQPSTLLAKGGEVSTNNFLRKRGKMK